MLNYFVLSIKKAEQNFCIAHSALCEYLFNGANFPNGLIRCDLSDCYRCGLSCYGLSCCDSSCCGSKKNRCGCKSCRCGSMKIRCGCTNYPNGLSLNSCCQSAKNQNVRLFQNGCLTSRGSTKYRCGCMSCRCGSMMNRYGSMKNRCGLTKNRCGCKNFRYGLPTNPNGCLSCHCGYLKNHCAMSSSLSYG